MFRRSLPSPPVTGGLPQPEGCGLSFRRLDDPKVPGRLDPFGSSRKDCGSSLASRSARSIGSFPPSVRRLQVSLQARAQCRPTFGRRVRVWLPKFREWLVTFREKGVVRNRSSPICLRLAKSNPVLAKSKMTRGLTSGRGPGYVHPRLIGGDSEQAPGSRETLRLARRRPGLRVRSSNGG